MKSKDQILKLAGEYAANYEKENGLTTHPKTASFHGYIAGYDDAKLEECEYASLNRQGWTRVEDGLPEDGSTVLVTNGERVKEVFFSKRTSRDTPTFIFTTMKKDEITHWMKLPEPPK